MEPINIKDKNSIKVCIFTLGCKVNQYESNVIIKILKEKGYAVTEKIEYCDKYIINTCAVTAEAEKKSRQVISKINKINGNAEIYIIGCASQNNVLNFKGKKNVKYIGGASFKYDIDQMLKKQGTYINNFPDKFEDCNGSITLKTRAYIKIQDGCNNFCSYCIIPYLRGRSRSRHKESIKEEILSLTNVKEFILTGINMSAYGKDINSSLPDLIDYLKCIKARIRLSSLENGIVGEKLLVSLKNLYNFCPHFHLSLQSGSDNVLKDMNRHYITKDFYNSILLIRKYFPNCAITTDIICGYPTETEQDFINTVEFCKKAKFSDIHIFNYSSRKGTRAGELKSIPNDIVKQRIKILQDIKQKYKYEYIQSNIGKTLTVLTEIYENKFVVGYTENYLKVYIKDNLELNELYKVVIIKPYLNGVKAKISK